MPQDHTSAGPRRLARRYAVLGLYQWQLTGEDPAEIARHFAIDTDWRDEVAMGLHGDDRADAAGGSGEVRYDKGLFEQLVLGVPREHGTIDAALGAVVDRPLSQVDPVERAILRLATFELLFCPETPYQVAINEAVDVAKLLGAEQGHRYVNGVLDKIARARRDADNGPGPVSPEGTCRSTT